MLSPVKSIWASSIRSTSSPDLIASKGNKAEETREKEETNAEHAEEGERARQEAANRERKSHEKIMAGLPKRIRDLEGNMGGLYQKVDAVIEKLGSAQTASADAKKEETAEADKEALDNLRKEYAELTPLLKQVDGLAKTLNDLQTQLGNAPQGVTHEEVGQAIEQSAEHSVEMSQLSAKHGNWRDIVSSDDFILFALEGGPTYKQYVAFQSMEPATQDAVLDRWQEDYADWWQKRGSSVFSPRATDAIRLIDAFNARGEEAEKAKREKEKQEKRDKDAKLRAAVAPTGAGGGGPIEPSASEAMREGYNSVRRASAPRF